MPNLIEEYFRSKKKTHWRTWVNKHDTAYPAGSICWCLFFPDDIGAPYHYGVEGSLAEAEEEIKWVIGSYLKTQGML